MAAATYLTSAKFVSTASAIIVIIINDVRGSGGRSELNSQVHGTIFYLSFDVNTMYGFPVCSCEGLHTSNHYVVMTIAIGSIRSRMSVFLYSTNMIKYI